MRFQLGTTVGSYEIRSLLGTGGMGEVYLARDPKLNRDVAIKVLSDDLATAAARRRFQREAQTASMLNHPYLLTVHDAGEFEGHQYLVTEFLDGGTLRSWMDSAIRERRSWREAIELVIGVADGLAAAHEAGILHRDIKPENILLTKGGYAKLADFGLAKLHEEPGALEGLPTRTAATRAGAVIGTVAYMSPEQALGQSLDDRSDIFSFGVVLYELLASHRPFRGASDVDVLHAIVHRDPDPLPDTIPAALRALVASSLEKDRSGRLASMREFVVELRRIVRQGDDVPAVNRTASRSPRRRTWPVLVAALLAIVLAAGWLGRGRRGSGVAPPGAGGTLAYSQLTALDSATQPALSPDGRMIAFVRGPHTSVPERSDPSQVWVKLLPDGEPVQLTHDDTVKFAPRFAPDGGRITYSTLNTSGFDAWVVPVLGGQEPRRFLANAEGVTWIGSRLLFSYLTQKGITMAVATATESRADERTVFVEDGIMDHFSYLSPGGTHLLLAEMGFDGWQPCRLAPFDGGTKGVKVGPQPAQCTGAAWSPDGKWMYFSADTGAGFHIWRQAFPDGAPEQVTSGITEEEGIEFSKDGRSFFTSVGTRQSTLWIHDAAGDRQVTSDAYAFNPAYSIDGSKLFYLVRTSTGTSVLYGGLWVLDLRSGQRQRVLPEFQMEHFAVAHDMNQVVLVARNEKGPAGVWLARLDGSVPPRQLTSNRGLQAFFDRRGDIFFAADEAGATFVYRVRSSDTAPVKALADQIFLLYGVSPDAKYLAVWMAGNRGGGPNAVGLYPTDGGAPIIVCVQCAYRSGGAGPQEVTWSPDGRFLYLALIGGAAVFAIPLRATGELPALPPGGLRSIAEIGALPGAKPLPAPGAVAGITPATYVYAKVSAQRNIYQVTMR